MEKIAIIGDIHGNKTALKAVLDDIEKRKINRIFCIGDLVSKGASPDETIDLVKEKAEIVVQGNCDFYMGAERALVKKFWTRMKIGEERAKFLRELPVSYDFYMSRTFNQNFPCVTNSIR